MNKKITTLTMIGVVLLLSGCTAKNATLNKNINESVINKNINTNQADDPLADWQTMSHPLSFPISYKYPPTWNIHKLSGQNIGWVKGPNDNPLFTVSELIGFRDKGIGLSKAVGISSMDLDIDFMQLAKKIDGQDMYMIQFKVPPSQGRGTIGHEKTYFEYQDRIYTIDFFDWNSENATTSPFYSTYQQIMSTFKIN
jgi:hypothetical protein